MKKKELGKLALLGIVGGLMALGQSGTLDASIDVQNLIAKPACKGKGGCGGLTAARDVHDEHADDEDDNDDDDEDSDDAEEADNEGTAKKEANKTEEKRSEIKKEVKKTAR